MTANRQNPQIILLSQRDRRTLQRLAWWADVVAEKITKQFYGHQFKFPLTPAFFEAQAHSKNIPVTELPQHFEMMQARYFRQIFQESLWTQLDEHRVGTTQRRMTWTLKN